MNLTQYESLPDSMDKNELKKYFISFLNSVDGQKNLNKMEVLEALSQLTDRQVYTYELLDEDIRIKIDYLIIKLWTSDSVEFADLATYIVVNLSLKESFCMMKNLLKSHLREDVKTIIKETIEEVGDKLDIPFIQN